VLQIITIEGDVTLDPDTPQETHLEPGFATQRCLDASGNVAASCGWLPPVPLTEAELAFAQTVLLAFGELDLESSSFLTIGGEQVTLINTGACPAGATVEHTVRPGDNLYGIGLQYNTTVNALIFNNNLESTTIVPGQTLTVICGAQGPASLPSLGAPPLVVESPPPAPAIDCSGFAATSPLDGLKYGENTFFWNAPNTAIDQYRVTVTGETGSASFTADGSNLSLVGELTYDSVGSGYTFSWVVEALVDGEVVCSVPPIAIYRESPPPFGGHDEPQVTPEPKGTEEPGDYDYCYCEGDYCECCYCEGEFCECVPCEDCQIIDA
jgi:hypothetical protein